MSLWRDFWADERGALLSAELAAVGTVAVIGVTVGLSSMSKSVNAELQEIAVSIRSLNQSYSVPGHASCGAWTAGSRYVQPDVNQSIQDLIGDCAETGKKHSDTKSEEAGKRRKDDDRHDRKKKDSGKKDRKDSNDEDQESSVLPQTDDNNAAVKDVDDESQMETVIEPLPGA